MMKTMMKTMTSKYALILAPALLLSVIQSATGASIYRVETDTNGDFVTGGAIGGLTNYWTGNGTVQANIAPDTVAGTNDTLVQDFSGTGTLGLGHVRVRTGNIPKWFDPQGTNNYDFSNSGVEWYVSVTLGSGTGDVILQTPVSYFGSNYQNLTIGDLQGVNKLSFEVNFSAPLAPIRASAGVPFLGGVRSTNTTAAVTATILNPITITDNDPTPGVLDLSSSPGIPAGSDMQGFPAAIGDWGDSATHSWNLVGGPTAPWYGPSHLDIDGGGVLQPELTGEGDGILDEIERFYATGIRYELTPDGGTTFANGSQFLFSFNGVQFEDSLATAQAGLAIPEPSLTALLGLGGLALALRRRRG